MKKYLLLHRHIPQNVNEVHAEERAGINDTLAVFLTRHVGSMWCAYLFVLLALLGLLGILSFLPVMVVLLVTWVSQTFIQLVLLPVIMVGQNILNRHAELMAEEQYATTKKVYADSEQLMLTLQRQEQKIKEIEQHLLQQLDVQKTIPLPPID